MRTAAIWVFGLFGTAVLGGFIGSRFDGLYSSGGAATGIIAGMALFACARLWAATRQ